MRQQRAGQRSALRGSPSRWTAFPVIAALCSGTLLAAAALAAHAPWTRVRSVSWTGPLSLPEDRCASVEAACLGRPLLLLSECTLRHDLELDRRTTRIELRRHLPSTLELRIEPCRAVARLDARTAVDARGRRLGPEHALAGLPLLSGFTLDARGDRLGPEMRRMLASLSQLFLLPTLAPSEVRLADGELELVLADSGARVRLDAARADEQLLKLRIFEQSLGGEPLPGSIDLRFQDQVVVREGGIQSASRSSR